MRLVKNNIYLLLIDEEAEIKENTWYENNGILFLSDEKYDDGNNPNNSNPKVTDYNNSVIAYHPLTKEAKELDLPLLPTPFEERFDIEKGIKEWYHQRSGVTLMHDPYLKELVSKIEAQSKQFSLEDMETLMEETLNWFGSGRDKNICDSKEFFEKYIQSLSTQQLPVSFEPEFEYYYHSSKVFYSDAEFVKCSKEQYNTIKEVIPTCPLKIKLKTATNSEGKEVIQGKYIY